MVLVSIAHREFQFHSQVQALLFEGLIDKKLQEWNRESRGSINEFADAVYLRWISPYSNGHICDL